MPLATKGPSPKQSWGPCRHQQAWPSACYPIHMVGVIPVLWYCCCSGRRSVGSSRPPASKTPHTAPTSEAVCMFEEARGRLCPP